MILRTEARSAGCTRKPIRVGLSCISAERSDTQAILPIFSARTKPRLGDFSRYSLQSATAFILGSAASAVKARCGSPSRCAAINTASAPNDTILQTKAARPGLFEAFRCLVRDRISRRCDVCRLLLVIGQGGTKTSREET